MIGLRILRFFLPPFHPLKYKYINWWYGKQVGGYFQDEQKYNACLNTNEEHILDKLHDKF